MKRVKFGMLWTVHGHQEIDLPDDIDADDEAAVKAYINRVWQDIPLPDGDYVNGSDVLDEECDIEIVSQQSSEEVLP